MDWFYYVMGKIFIWGLMILVIGGIGYYLGYNHATLPLLKDFTIVRTEELKRPVPKVTEKKEVLIDEDTASKSATPSATTKSPTPTE